MSERSSSGRPRIGLTEYGFGSTVDDIESARLPRLSTDRVARVRTSGLDPALGHLTHREIRVFGFDRPVLGCEEASSAAPTLRFASFSGRLAKSAERGCSVSWFREL